MRLQQLNFLPVPGILCGAEWCRVVHTQSSMDHYQFISTSSALLCFMCPSFNLCETNGEENETN